MDARSLFTGDTFVNMHEDDYAALNKEQRSKVQKAVHVPGGA